MNRKKRFRQLLEAVEEAHSQFQTEWNRLRPKHSVSETYDLLSSLYIAREHAVHALFTPLREVSARFLRGECDAVDTVLDFLEVDIATFRAGYAKEWYYRKLKRIALTEQQCARIKAHALALFAKSEYRREWRELSRLLIVVADASTVAALRQFAIESTDEFVKRRALLVLKAFSHSRSDAQLAQQK